MTNRVCEVLIVGAGLAGVAAGRRLQAAGVDVLLVDKGRSVGGRMATRRMGGGAADHGAQFFTANSPEFQATVDGWEQDGLVFLWDIGWSAGSLTGNDEAGQTRYASRGGMNRLLKQLAADLPTETGVRIASLRQTPQGWEAQAESGDTYQAAALILTPPPPQSLALLAAGQVELATMDAEILAGLTYSPVLTGIFHIDGEVTIPAPGAVHRPVEPLPWIADNRQKGVSDGVTIVTIHSNGDYAQRYWDAPEVEILETMKAVLSRYLPQESQVVESQVQRWRYAFPRKTHHQRTLRAAGVSPLYFAGDAFHGPLIEGAWLSGEAAAAALLTDAEFLSART